MQIVQTRRSKRPQWLAFHKRATRPRPVAVRIFKAEDLAVLSLLAVVALVQIAARSALFEDETKRIGINIGRAKDEKSQAKDEKSR